MDLSRADCRLLDALQRDATPSQNELADLAGMSRTSCWRRIRDLEKSGVIEKQVALLNPRKLGFQIHVLLTVAIVEHTDENRDSFEAHVQTLPEVTECYSISGERDYMLQVVVTDMDAYNDFINSQILHHPAVRSASSTFALRRQQDVRDIPARSASSF